MNPSIVVTVHPINTEVHTTVPPGFRWAVEWTGSTLNAGWEPSQHAALLAGEASMVCAVRAARMCGAVVGHESVILDHDPIGSGSDHISVMES